MTNVTQFSMTRQIAYDPTRTMALGHENYALYPKAGLALQAPAKTAAALFLR